MKNTIRINGFAYKYVKEVIIAVLALTFIACVVPRKVKGSGCILLGDEYAILIRKNRLVWVDEIKTDNSKHSITNEKWSQASYTGYYYPLGMYGHLGKFYSKIDIDTLALMKADSSCSEKFSKLWQ